MAEELRTLPLLIPRTVGKFDHNPSHKNKLKIKDAKTDFFFFKQKTAYEILASDWSSDVCASDLAEC